MSPATRMGMMTAAQACADAGIAGAAKMLQHVADDPGATEDEAWRWLDRASFACDCVFEMRLSAGEPSDLACNAGKVCRDECMAAINRMSTAGYCEHCSNDGDCSVCGRAA